MRKLRRQIPSGNLLYVFDAAARLESFTRAAEDLNVTPAAVSHSIRQLEAGLGFPLFQRKHRQIRLSAEGARLYESLASGLDRLENIIDDIHTERSTAVVRIYASITLGTYWLLPRLGLYPDSSVRIEMQLYNSDRTLELADDGLSLAITNGRNTWPGYDVHPFAPEIFSPVCSPGYLAEHGHPQDLPDLLRHRLLHLDDNYHDGLTWAGFLAAHGLHADHHPDDITHNNYILVIHAALTGAGIGLGWHHSMGDLLQSGALVRAIDLDVDTGRFFNIVNRNDCISHPNTLLVRDWLTCLAQKDRDAARQTRPLPDFLGAVAEAPSEQDSHRESMGLRGSDD